MVYAYVLLCGFPSFDKQHNRGDKNSDHLWEEKDQQKNQEYS